MAEPMAFARPGRGPVTVDPVQKDRDDACENDGGEIGANRNQLDGSISDWPFPLGAQRRAVLFEGYPLMEAGCNMSVNKVHARTGSFEAFCN